MIPLLLMLVATVTVQYDTPTTDQMTITSTGEDNDAQRCFCKAGYESWKLGWDAFFVISTDDTSGFEIVIREATDDDGGTGEYWLTVEGQEGCEQER